MIPIQLIQQPDIQQTVDLDRRKIQNAHDERLAEVGCAVLQLISGTKFGICFEKEIYIYYIYILYIYMKLLCLMVPCFLVLHFSPKPWLLLDNAKFPQVFGPVPQGHRKDCFVALPVCPASSQPSDRSSSSTRQCHWRGGDRGCYEVSSFLGEHAMSKFQMSLSPGFPPNQQNGFQGLTDLLSLQ